MLNLILLSFVIRNLSHSIDGAEEFYHIKAQKSGEIANQIHRYLERFVEFEEIKRIKNGDVYNGNQNYLDQLFKQIHDDKTA